MGLAEAEALSRAASPFPERRYGVVRVTHEWEMARSSFYHPSTLAVRPDRFYGGADLPSFVRQPECNGCVERFIRTLKEHLRGGGRVFQNVEELRCALAEFRERYNQRWIVQRWGYLTPAQVRQQFLALGAAA